MLMGELGLFADCDHEADVCLDWRGEIRKALPGEGNKLDHAYLTIPEGKLPRYAKR